MNRLMGFCLGIFILQEGKNGGPLRRVSPACSTYKRGILADAQG